MSTGTGTQDGGRERRVPGKNHTTIKGACVSTTGISNLISGGDQPPEIPEAISPEEDERNQKHDDGSTTRWRKLVGQRPTSAAAVTLSASARTSQGRDFISSPEAVNARGRVTFEEHRKAAGRTGKSSPSGNKYGTRPREVPICWGAERMPRRRPKPLGRTNSSKVIAKVHT